jgi:serine/threonine-protein kinase
MILDVRSDIYSLGATLYHLLTGIKPAVSTEQVKPIGSLGMNFSEGVVYIVERCMHQDPAKRFQTAAELLRAVRNIRKLDRRWKVQTLKKDVAAIVLTGLFAASGILSFLGWQQLGREKVERYETTVYELENTDNQIQMETLFRSATEAFPDRLDAYHAKALAMFRSGRYQECQEFIDTSLIGLHPSPDEPGEISKLGDMYYVMAGCYFEQEDYPNAAVYYESAVANNQNNAEYYRDYAIALVRLGDISGAESLLLTVESMGLGGDSLSLLRGEIAYANGEYPEAVAYFKESIQAEKDDDTLYRAYRVCSDAYKQQDDFESEITLLTEAVSALPITRFNELTERLADAYVRGAESGDVNREEYYQKAAEAFVEILDRGYNTFITRQNLAVVYQQSGDLDTAELVLLALLEEYPEDYRVPMRLAYLYADMQTRIANEQRDYTLFAECYDKALALYEEHVKDGFSDPEMLMLTDMLSQLADGGWITEKGES